MNIWQDYKGKKGMISITFRTVFRGRKGEAGKGHKEDFKGPVSLPRRGGRYQVAYCIMVFFF